MPSPQEGKPASWAGGCAIAAASSWHVRAPRLVQVCGHVQVGTLKLSVEGLGRVSAQHLERVGNFKQFLFASLTALVRVLVCTGWSRECAPYRVCVCVCACVCVRVRVRVRVLVRALVNVRAR